MRQVREAPVTYQVTDLARSHRDVVDAARAGGARIRDKDGLTLLLAPAEQVERDSALVELAMDVLRAEHALSVDFSQRGPALYGGLAWLSALPDESQREFVREITDALLVAASGAPLEVVVQLLDDWRSTADAWLDPTTRDALLAAETNPLADVEL